MMLPFSVSIYEASAKGLPFLTPMEMTARYLPDALMSISKIYLSALFHVYLWMKALL